MDVQTLAAYDRHADGYCRDWLLQPPPEDLQRLWRRYLVPGGRTIDVGSGSGRDADWLDRHGYPCCGVDGSNGLIEQARRRFPALEFHRALLPDLQELPGAFYSNVVCETVIMHLTANDVGRAVSALRRLLAPGGVLYLSWRVGGESDTRDEQGRLYSAFPAAAARAALGGLCVGYDREEFSASSGKRVHRLVASLPTG